MLKMWKGNTYISGFKSVHRVEHSKTGDAPFMWASLQLTGPTAGVRGGPAVRSPHKRSRSISSYFCNVSAQQVGSHGVLRGLAGQRLCRAWFV